MGYPSQAVAAYPCKLQCDFANNGTYVTIAEVKDIKGPGYTSTVEDVTNHDSFNGVREVVATIISGDKLTFEVNWIPTDGTQDQLTGLDYLFWQRARRNFKFVGSDTSHTAIIFPGIVTKLDKTAAVKGIMMMPVEVEITGTPSWA